MQTVMLFVCIFRVNQGASAFISIIWQCCILACEICYLVLQVIIRSEAFKIISSCVCVCVRTFACTCVHVFKWWFILQYRWRRNTSDETWPTSLTSSLYPVTLCNYPDNSVRVCESESEPRSGCNYAANSRSIRGGRWRYCRWKLYTSTEKQIPPPNCILLSLCSSNEITLIISTSSLRLQTKCWHTEE